MRIVVLTGGLGEMIGRCLMRSGSLNRVPWSG